MKTARLMANLFVGGIAIFFIAVAFFGIREKLSDGAPPYKPETKAAREERYEREAKEQFASATTNDVIGYTRTINSASWIFSSTPVSNWWATATVEHLNKFGGVERVTLRWRFKESFGDVYIRRLTAEEFLAR